MAMTNPPVVLSNSSEMPSNRRILITSTHKSIVNFTILVTNIVLASILDVLETKSDVLEMKTGVLEIKTAVLEMKTAVLVIAYFLLDHKY
jgi:small neutral amino acid transporter SnatA (MarC family)